MIELQNIVGLSDWGYQHNLLLRPDNTEAAKRLGLSSEKFYAMHAKHRAPVEIMNAITKFFSFAAKKVTQPPEFQAFTLLIIYYLSALTMKASPAFTVSRILNK
jgi:hypothetical protein